MLTSLSSCEREQDLDYYPKSRSTTDTSRTSNSHCPFCNRAQFKAWFFITVGWTGQRPGYMEWQQLRALHEAGQPDRRTRLDPHSSDPLQPSGVTERVSRCQTHAGGQARNLHHHDVSAGRPRQPRVLAACAEAGYTQVFTSIPKAEPQPAGPTIGRLNIRGDMTLEWIAKLFQPDSGVLSSLERQHQIKATAKTLLGDRLYEKLWAVFNRQEPETDAGEATAREDSAHHQ